ncbi:hypothetical protein [Actinoplanes sp. NPDC051494]|uniref:hypothetical protein n=1 Tax=Actinoplanes sp. NPDC051494 TaxID=3363907 RepID=UPI003794D9E7
MTGQDERPMLNPNLLTPPVTERFEPNGAITLIVDGRVLGQIFPEVISEPDGWWFGRRYGNARVAFRSRASAHRHVLGELG